MVMKKADLATNFDLVSATKQTVMSDERDFSRPREPFYMSSIPTDISQANDKKPFELPSWLSNKEEKPTVTETSKTPEAPKVSNDIKNFQTFFGLQPTGIVDDKLAQAAKAMEDKISKAVNNPGARGLLWDDSSKTFKTTLADLQEALKKIEQYEANKQVATNAKTARIQAFSALIKNNLNGD